MREVPEGKVAEFGLRGSGRGGRCGQDAGGLEISRHGGPSFSELIEEGDVVSRARRGKRPLPQGPYVKAPNFAIKLIKCELFSKLDVQSFLAGSPAPWIADRIPHEAPE
jgi:hypothetical protein